MGANLDLHSVLERVVAEAVDLADARYGALGVLNPKGDELVDFITAGVSDEQRVAIGDSPKGIGLFAHVLNTGTLRVAELSEHFASVGFPPNHPPMKSYLGVPVRVGDEVFGILYLTDKATGEVFTDVDEELVNSLAAAAGAAIRNARLYETIAHREAVIDAFRAVAIALLSGADRDDVLHLLVQHARSLVSADGAALVLRHPEGGLYVAVVAGAAAEVYGGMRFPSENSPTEHVLATGEPIVIDNVNDLPGIGDRLRGNPVGPLMLVPIAIDGPNGSLSVSRTLDKLPFTPGELEVLQSFAAQASVVLEYDRRRQREDLLARIDDQRRIAEDLHDSAIQEIFAASLSLSSAATKVTDDAARKQLTNAIEGLDRAIKLIRNVIFDLAAAPSSQLSARRRMIDTARQATHALGFDVEVLFEGPIDTVGDDMSEQLALLVKEALSNVARHAQATSATVQVTATARELIVIVRDNGVGISGDRVGSGTVNMVNRAERFGGTCTIAAVPWGGTVVHWRVPLTP